MFVDDWHCGRCGGLLCTECGYCPRCVGHGTSCKTRKRGTSSRHMRSLIQTRWRVHLAAKVSIQLPNVATSQYLPG